MSGSHSPQCARHKGGGAGSLRSQPSLDAALPTFLVANSIVTQVYSCFLSASSRAIYQTHTIKATVAKICSRSRVEPEGEEGREGDVGRG